MAYISKITYSESDLEKLIARQCKRSYLFLKKLISGILRILLFILLFIVLGALLLGAYLLFQIIQEMLFVPKDYLIWTSNNQEWFISLLLPYITWGGFYLFLKGREDTRSEGRSKVKFLRRHRKSILALFIASNMVFLYVIISSVTVITNNKIIDYSFLYPQGREYSYKDIVQINAGVYGKKQSFPSLDSKGDYFYIVELENGKKIKLTEAGGFIDEHEYFTIEKLDRQFVDMGISKISSMDNFKYTTEHLDEIYSDAIRRVLENNAH
ncbi:hypothetical protein ACFQV5_08040 [Paenibacillus sp. GCM10028914]